MRCLSLWQPHAQAIGLRLKPFETRGWKTDYRGPLAIHAAVKRFRERDYSFDYVKEVALRFRTKNFPLHALDYGKVICVCDLVDCFPTGILRGHIGQAYEFWGDFRDKGDDGKERYAFQLENIRLIVRYKRPAITGRQGFFQVPDEIADLEMLP
jgi:hypothetical protein